jgi:hypothetical protein
LLTGDDVQSLLTSNFSEKKIAQDVKESRRKQTRIVDPLGVIKNPEVPLLEFESGEGVSSAGQYVMVSVTTGSGN